MFYYFYLCLYIIFLFIFHVHPQESNFSISCDDLQSNIKPIKLLAKGVVKNIYLVEWKNQTIVMAKLNENQFNEDFNSNRQNLIMFQNNSFITQLLGFCRKNIIFTKFYRNGNVLQNLREIFQRHRILEFVDRFRFCQDYVEILKLLHQHQRVMCDS